VKLIDLQAVQRSTWPITGRCRCAGPRPQRAEKRSHGSCGRGSRRGTALALKYLSRARRWTDGRGQIQHSEAEVVNVRRGHCDGRRRQRDSPAPPLAPRPGLPFHTQTQDMSELLACTLARPERLELPTPWFVGAERRYAILQSSTCDAGQSALRSTQSTLSADSVARKRNCVTAS
jgi:hypothetical protein